MNLAYPYALLLLVFLPFLAIWRNRRPSQSAISFPSLHLLDGLPGDRTRLVENAKFGLQLLMLGLLIVALARPRWPDEGTRIPAESVAIQMVLDISGSMAEQDVATNQARSASDGSLPTETRRLRSGLGMTPGPNLGSRLDAAKHAFRSFVRGNAEPTRPPDEPRLEGRGDDLIGLITFAARSENVCPPTLSHSVVLRMLDEAEPQGTPPESSTNIGDALIEGIELLRRAAPNEKILILLSDGEHNVPAEVVAGALKPRQAARIAEGLGIRVYTISVGPAAEAEKAALAGEALQDVAEMTGGSSFRAHDMRGLLDVCSEIDRLERTRVESFQYYRYHELYPWLGLACLVLFLSLSAMETTRWLQVP